METLYRLSYWGLAALWQRGKPYTGSGDVHNRGRRDFCVTERREGTRMLGDDGLADVLSTCTGLTAGAP
ncbi:hypothetical protein ACFUG8_21460, partial [Streptomyces cyaneofuscatus]|uniref:hypothetical protein n=1 Tax=Streptomyces cyaneofuscatus TaxID=66883 RepID=UPI00363FE228